ncbi:heme ABC exporter ATP-binding protein CcmA [Pseudoneobacillus rhizosphaerae]|uniref:ABC transporter ATP-binding protein NatA n=1 Tax=Pseudoneobacillus rhizosphaerae TaxID=2880968 RepID=A0A9C7GC06_9BACI|nr:heme ABC exporter ATP-binding protein CcmA [Pseudoneobacillus rhizosphaerae]CAG9609322.1 ABC transporter ATP-binding protein NatA [Pseudoneobacillus rhizosphaerae]
MIQTKQLIKRVGDKVILRGVNLSIKEGQTVAILGPNGAGKSTILKVIATLIKPSSGEVLINNKEIKKHALEVKSLIGYLPHASLLYDHFTPLENLILFGKLYGVKDVEKRAKELIEKVGLSFFLHEPVKSFSRGMIQRVAIARAIVHEPRIILLDEPHTGLDQQAIVILNKVILEMKAQGTTTVMVTHDFKQAAEICDRIIIVKNGKIVDDFMLENNNLDLVFDKYALLTEGVV